MSQAETSCAAGPWSEQTCVELLGLLLRASGLSPHQAPPADWLDKLRATASREEDLASWLLTVVDTDREWSHIVARLPVWLIENSSSYLLGTIEPGQGCCLAAAADCRGQLLTMSHLLLRLQTLETRYARELERQKREAIYHFAYGLSHELNNPLANIATRAGLLASEETQPRRRNMLETIVASAMRGCEMLGDLMLVARPPKMQFATTRIDRLLAELVERANHWGEALQVQVRGDYHSQASLEVDAVALTEAVWAVVRNAMEALPDGGQVTLRLFEGSETESGPTGAAVCIEVSDPGVGLSSQSLAHCFDPYYSGREAGRGLGLGLSKAKRIIEMHSGQLELDNRPGGGCLASIVLPLSDQH
jgi:signal transduction histidine kinase